MRPLTQVSAELRGSSLESLREIDLDTLPAGPRKTAISTNSRTKTIVRVYADWPAAKESLA